VRVERERRRPRLPNRHGHEAAALSGASNVTNSEV
jgi:hypothetical protein